jgi:hypothetical protein
MAAPTTGRVTVEIEFNARSRSAFNSAMEEFSEYVYGDLPDGVTLTRLDVTGGEVHSYVENGNDEDDEEEVAEAPKRRGRPPGKTSKKPAARRDADENAPYGYKADGTPRAKPGRKPASAAAPASPPGRKGKKRRPGRPRRN